MFGSLPHLPHVHHPPSPRTPSTTRLQVYGNLSDRSGSGVCFTRNPATGEKDLFGEFLPNAQASCLMRCPLSCCDLPPATPHVTQALGIWAHNGIEPEAPAPPIILLPACRTSRKALTPLQTPRPNRCHPHNMHARVQGEDVVSGIRTPVPVREMRSFFPGVYEELKAETSRLEAHMQNAQVGKAGGRGRGVQEGKTVKTVTRDRL